MLEHDPVVPVLLALLVIFLGAKLGGYLASRVGQPAVLGELLAGIILGNLTLMGFGGLKFVTTNEVIEVIAGIGVVLLLFEVGLESNLRDLMRVGLAALLVAVTGVVAPLTLGFFVGRLLLPDASDYAHAFLGAALCATSVGITARVLKDLGKINARESRIILGAAVIDDVLGLMILAITVGMINQAASGNTDGISLATITWISLKAIGFLLVAIVGGLRLAPFIFKLGSKIPLTGMMQATTLSICFAFSILAAAAGLAPIVGAFAAGLIMDASGLERYFPHEEKSLEDLLLPVSHFFVPVFFVTMGMKVDLAVFADPAVLFLASGITLAAIIGKQACALAAVGSQLNRWAIGIGMIPRGEVGLIFAGIGAKLMLDGKPVVDATLFSAIVVMVAVTTVMTPPLLKWSMALKGFGR